MSSETELILNYYQARQAHEEADARKKTLHKLMKGAEAKLIDKWLETKTKTVKRDDGTTVSLKSDTNISVTIAGTEAVREWLCKENGDDDDFTEVKLKRASLLEFVKKKLEAGIPPEEMPDELKINTRPTVSVRGWKEYLARQGQRQEQ